MGDVIHATFGDEVLLNKEQVAMRLGYTKRTVEKLTAQGMPSVVKGIRRMYRESACRNWIAHHERKASAGRA